MKTHRIWQEVFEVILNSLRLSKNIWISLFVRDLNCYVMPKQSKVNNNIRMGDKYEVVLFNY